MVFVMDGCYFYCVGGLLFFNFKLDEEMNFDLMMYFECYDLMMNEWMKFELMFKFCLFIDVVYLDGLIYVVGGWVL